MSKDVPKRLVLLRRTAVQSDRDQGDLIAVPVRERSSDPGGTRTETIIETNRAVPANRVMRRRCTGRVGGLDRVFAELQLLAEGGDHQQR
jgi:hypothetical protein